MGILDEAIKEHLELKRQHGADDSELKQLEDEAFGPAERPGAEGEGAAISDTAAEAPTEFMAQPDQGAPEAPPPPARREPAAGMADIQEAPAPPEPEEAAAGEPAAEEGQPTAEEQPAAEEPQPAAEEDQPAAEHEAVTEPPEVGSHTTEERHAIADQPTEMFDVEGEFAASATPAPPDEEIVAEEMAEARLGPAEKLPSPDDELDEELDADEEDDFFSEQRLSEELDQALEAPAPVARDPEPDSEGHPEVREPDSEEHDEFRAPISEEHTQIREPDPEEQPVAKHDDGDEDVLDHTPEFLEDHPEDEQLWFEQKPPKDFDFDD